MAKITHQYSRDIEMMLRIRGKVARVIWATLVRRVDIHTNKLKVSQAEIAKEFGKTPSQVSKAIKSMKEVEVLRVGKDKELFFNPYVTFYAEFDEDKPDDWIDAFNGEGVVHPLPMHKEWDDFKEMNETNR
jgi:hypothetical protein